MVSRQANDHKKFALSQKRQLEMAQILMHTHVVLDIYKQHSEESDVLVLLHVDRPETSVLDDPQHGVEEVHNGPAEVLRWEVQFEIDLTNGRQLSVSL